jgi:hypothetical protein
MKGARYRRPFHDDDFADKAICRSPTKVGLSTTIGDITLGGESLHRDTLDRWIAEGKVKLVEINSAPVPRKNILVAKAPFKNRTRA